MAAVPHAPQQGLGLPEPARGLTLWLYNDRGGERQDAANCLLMRCSIVARGTVYARNNVQKDDMIREFQKANCDILWFRQPFDRSDHYRGVLKRSILLTS